MYKLNFKKLYSSFSFHIIYFLYIFFFAIVVTLPLFSQAAGQEGDYQQKPLLNDNGFETITDKNDKQNSSQKENTRLSINNDSPYSLKSNFSVYDNPYLRMSMSYPMTWDLKEGYDPIIEFAASLDNISDKYRESVRIYFIPAGTRYLYPSTDSLLSTVDAKWNEFVNNLPEGKILSKNSSTFKDMQAYKMTYSFTDDTFRKPILTKSMAVYFIHNNIFYLITFNSESEKYQNYLPVFQKMIDSFRITSNVFDNIETHVPINKNDFSSLYTNTTWGVTIPYPEDWIIDKNIDYNGNEDCIYDVVSFMRKSFSNNDMMSTKDIYLRVNTDAFFALDLLEMPFNLQNFSRFIVETYNPAMIPLFWPINIELNKTMAGHPAFQLFYYKEGGEYKVMETGIIIDQIAYQMIYSAEPKKFDEYLPYVNEMLNSMKVEPVLKINTVTSYNNAKIINVLNTPEHALQTEMCLQILSSTR